jgi:RND superfamily putative drug exporter
VYLLAASVLAVFATLGLTIGIGQHILGYGSLVYFVPFAAGVLLVSLGSDYNVFVVGRIWEEARRRPVADAVAVAAPQASRAITTAGVALAASFAMLAVIPLEQFRQIALAMALGVVLASLTSNSEASMLTTVHPWLNAVRSSSCVTRRGPQVPGWRSLKQTR